MAQLTNYETDETGSTMDREYTGSFEGPEKTLEMCFRPSISLNYDRRGLRALSRSDLNRICDRARCTILSSIHNECLDAYVLSESSLFIYPHMMVLKTCGTTTLLRCIATVLELAKTIEWEVDWVGYSRKNFNFPGDQCFPHESFYQEVEYLESHRHIAERLGGNGYTLGPVTKDHWFVYVADQTVRSNNLDTDRVLNIMMFDIDPEVASVFYHNEYDCENVGSAQTKRAGIDTLCPGAIIDAKAFEPCGYSMNAIRSQFYSTMHITPELGSSYASFETNQQVISYTDLIHDVVRIFKPKRFVMTLMADEDGLVEMIDNPFKANSRDAKVNVHNGGKEKDVILSYRRSTTASIKAEEDYCCMVGNWVLCTKKIAAAVS